MVDIFENPLVCLCVVLPRVEFEFESRVDGFFNSDDSSRELRTAGIVNELQLYNNKFLTI